jgi:uncharacterized membrane protein YeaQ/YmgE (transglycosylase-associated protein family)
VGRTASPGNSRAKPLVALGRNARHGAASDLCRASLVPQPHLAHPELGGRTMDLGGLLIALAIGAVAGFLAGQIVKGHGFGLAGNVVVGVAGAVVFGLLFGRFTPLSNATLNSIAGATIGAVLLLAAIRVFKQAA